CQRLDVTHRLWRNDPGMSMLATLSAERPAVDEGTRVQLSGVVGSRDMLAIMNLLGDLQLTGSLQLARGGWSARLGFRDGRLVAATLTDDAGLDGLALLGQADCVGFVFSESPTALPANGVPDVMPRALDDASVLLTSCPKLGFADDPGSHLERPTAIHRCFAKGSVQSVSTL